VIRLSTTHKQWWLERGFELLWFLPRENPFAQFGDGTKQNVSLSRAADDFENQLCGVTSKGLVALSLDVQSNVDITSTHSHAHTHTHVWRTRSHIPTHTHDWSVDSYTLARAPIPIHTRERVQSSARAHSHTHTHTHARTHTHTRHADSQYTHDTQYAHSHTRSQTRKLAFEQLTSCALRAFRHTTFTQVSATVTGATVNSNSAYRTASQNVFFSLTVYVDLPTGCCGYYVIRQCCRRWPVKPGDGQGTNIWRRSEVHKSVVHRRGSLRNGRVSTSQRCLANFKVPVEIWHSSCEYVLFCFWVEHILMLLKSSQMYRLLRCT